MQRRSLLLALLPLLGCAAARQPAGAARPSAAPDLLAGRLARIVDALETRTHPPVDPAAFARAGLAALEQRDPALRLALGPEGVSLRRGDATLAPCRGPLPEALACAVAEAHRASPVLGAAGLDAAEAAFVEGGTRAVPRGLYHPAAEWQAMRRPPGAFSSVGLHYRREEGAVRIVEVLSGSPGERAGVDRGDELTALDGDPVEGLSLDEVTRRLRGLSGSRVRLALRSPDGARREAEAIRAEVDFSLGRAVLLPGGFAYVSVAGLGARTAERVAARLGVLRGEAAEGRLAGVVLDLRGLRGGTLDHAAQVASLFVGPGPLFALHGPAGAVEPRARPPGQALFRREPLAVLVDDETGGTVEALAAALQDRARATVVGSRTAGVGTVLRTVDLGDLGGLALPAARIHRGEGPEIEGLGITPDLCTAAWPATAPEAVTLDLVRERLATAPAECPRRHTGKPRPAADLDLAVALRVLDSPLRLPAQ